MQNNNSNNDQPQKRKLPPIRDEMVPYTLTKKEIYDVINWILNPYDSENEQPITNFDQEVLAQYYSDSTTVTEEPTEIQKGPQLIPNESTQPTANQDVATQEHSNTDTLTKKRTGMRKFYENQAVPHHSPDQSEKTTRTKKRKSNVLEEQIETQSTTAVLINSLQLDTVEIQNYHRTLEQSFGDGDRSGSFSFAEKHPLVNEEELKDLEKSLKQTGSSKPPVTSAKDLKENSESSNDGPTI